MSEKKNKKIRPSIAVTKDGPYVVKNLDSFENSKGESIPEKPQMALCRCGQSSSKPFCDGTHVSLKFSGEKNEKRLPDKLDDYKGKEITIHDNRGVCSHRGHCTANLPKVFRLKQKPWIDPDAADPEEVARVIEMCPSGALSYTIEGVLHKDQDRDPRIVISKNGPYDIEGGIEFKDPDGNTPESKEHFTLCRCGGSRNKPFCDGKHWHIKFSDEKN